MILHTANLADRWALTTDDELVTIYNLFDAHGERTQDPAAAVAFTAGQGALIFAFRVADMPDRMMN